MSHLDPKRAASRSELRNFGLLVGGAFLILGGLTYWRHRPAAVFGTLSVLGAALVLGGAVAPATLARVYTAWMRLAELLSRVTTPIFMGVVYFVVLSPIGLLMRLFGRNPLRAHAGSTEWVTRANDARRSALQRQF